MTGRCGVFCRHFLSAIRPFDPQVTLNMPEFISMRDRATPAERKPTLATEASRELRVPPHSMNMEQAVLAALMSIAESWDQVSEVLNESDFYAQRHRLIFQAISNLAAVSMPWCAKEEVPWATICQEWPGVPNT